MSFFAITSCKSELDTVCLLDGFAERRKDNEAIRKFQSYFLDLF